jgi:hypothetical protein
MECDPMRRQLFTIWLQYLHDRGWSLPFPGNPKPSAFMLKTWYSLQQVSLRKHP